MEPEDKTERNIPPDNREHIPHRKQLTARADDEDFSYHQCDSGS